MWHIIIHLIKLIVKESKEGKGYKSANTRNAFQDKVLDMGEHSRLYKADIIASLGSPNKITDLDQGRQRLNWKGKTYDVSIYVNVMDQFEKITELYT